eukprot:6526795-Pyramimonas_sp.AAC.1
MPALVPTSGPPVHTRLLHGARCGALARSCRAPQRVGVLARCMSSPSLGRPFLVYCSISCVFFFLAK